MSATMIAATYTQGGNYAVENLPVPEIGDDEILLKVMASSICGTDARIIRSGHRKLFPGQKIILGHEFAGVIEKIGPRVSSYSEGMRVAVAPNIGCGACEFCAQGLTNMCPTYSAFGIDMDGAHAEYVRIPHAAIAQGSVVAVPENVSFIEASLIEPLSCVVNGSRSCRIGLGDDVLIFGAGPIGLMHLMLALASGAGRVFVADVQKHRLQAAAKLGACCVDSKQEDVKERINKETSGRGVDVVITACPVPSVQEQALSFLAPYGRLCFFGGLPTGTQVTLDTNIIHYKNLIVTGVTGGSPHDFRLAMKLISSKKINVMEVVSHLVNASEMESAFEAALSGDCMKVVLQYGRPLSVDIDEVSAMAAQKA